ncbi:MAG TPA: PAS domain S-box protein [Terriglobales bacterium]|nr:PAS domain S-box protein [Terriglobales bacterium]
MTRDTQLGTFGGDLDRVNILMVDDQPAKLLTYEAILSDLGENLIKATSGREALDQLLKHDISVVLMDVSMPEIDGFELAEMIRQHPRFQKTAIIFISGVHLSDTDRIRGYQRGAVDYISVPVVPEVLRAKVTVFVELHRKTRQLEKLNRELESRVEERTQELRESEDQFRTLANSIPQLAWMANPDGSIFWFNQRWFDYTGASPGMSDGFGWRDIVHPDHVSRVETGLKKSWSNGELWEETFPLRSKEGQYAWFLTRTVPICDSNGKVVRWFGTGTDISAQIEAQAQIRKLNSQLEQRVAELETIMQVLPVGIALAHDPDCEYISGNTALAELLGVPPGGNLLYRDASDAPYEVFRGDKKLNPNQLPVQTAAATGKAVGSTELLIRLTDGTERHVLASASPLFDEAGAVRGAVGAFFDVSTRKQMENMLRERADLLELATEAVMVRDLDGTLQYWNSGAEALYGWNREEIIGRNIHQVLNTEFPAPLEEIEAALTSFGTWEGNLIQETRDHRKVTVSSRKALNRERGVVLEINRDITARLQAEEALRHTEKLAAMGRVAGIIAHEINNPLEAITNAFFLLRDHPSLDEEARQYASLAEQELVRVSHITRQTLSFYRESKQPMLLSVPELLDDVLELQTRRFQVGGIELQRRYRSAGQLQGFPVELKQVFLNLVGNAIQAMPRGGRLRISVRDSGRWNGSTPGVVISIVDTGSGIRPKDARHLFEPFFTTKSEKGTGLGLWISRGIIQKYEGDIRFRSMETAAGNQTCFKVFIPIATADNALKPAVRAEAAGGSRVARGNRG